jgi:hypothetical protein
LLGCITIRRIRYSHFGTAGCAAGIGVLVTFTFIYEEAIVMWNGGKDLEGYSRDFLIVSLPTHEAVL